MVMWRFIIPFPSLLFILKIFHENYWINKKDGKIDSKKEMTAMILS